MNIAVLMTSGCQRTTGIIRYDTDASIETVRRCLFNLIKVSKQTLPKIELVELVLMNLNGSGGVLVVNDCEEERDFGVVPDWTIHLNYDGTVNFRSPIIEETPCTENVLV